MTKFFRMTAVAATVAAMALAATPAQAAPATPNENATATARIIKPLTLTWIQDLDLGDILLSGAGDWAGAIVGVSSGGVLDCANTNVVCSGTVQPAMYNVSGTQGQTVTIYADDVVLTHADGVETLLLDVDNPGSVTLANSGAPGSDLALGGSISVNSTTLDGVYTGTFDVTVDY